MQFSHKYQQVAGRTLPQMSWDFDYVTGPVVPMENSDVTV